MGVTNEVRLGPVFAVIAVMGFLGGCQPSSQGHEASASSSTSASATAGAAVAAPLEATQKGGPKRADGFWEFGFDGAKEQYCVGDGSEEKYSLADALSMLGDCSKKDFERTPNGWRFETVCKMMGVTTTQKGVITGDFRNNYRIDQEVTRSPGGAVKGEIVARRLGECPAPYKPGDLVSSGTVINMAH